MAGPIAEVKDSARRMARAAAFSAAFSLFGLALILAGLGSLSAAAWILIAMHHGAIFAFVVVGAVHIGLGGIFLALATQSSGQSDRHHSRHDSSHDAPGEPFVRVAEAFATGLQAGRAARRR